MKRRGRDKRAVASKNLAQGLQRKVEQILQKHQVSKAAHAELVAHFEKINHYHHKQVESLGKDLNVFLHEMRGGLNGILMTTEVLQHELSGEVRFSEALTDLSLMRTSILRTLSTMDKFLKGKGGTPVSRPIAAGR